MNAATRAAIAYCFAKGHTPVAIHNSFSGLVRHHSDEPVGSVRDISWLDAEAWCSRGGSEIGTNRELPSQAAYGDQDGIPVVAEVFKKYNINALFIVGGFEAVAGGSYIGVVERQVNLDFRPELQVPIPWSWYIADTASQNNQVCMYSTILSYPTD